MKLNIEKKYKYFSIFWSFLWVISFTSLMTATKFLSFKFSIITLVHVRLFFGLVLTLFLFNFKIKTIKAKQLPFYFLRSITFSFGMLCTYYTYSKLPIALAGTIGFFSPIVTVTMSAIFFKEKFNFYNWCAIIAGYLGVLVIMQPKSFIFNLALFIAIIGNIFSALSMLITKKLSKTESYINIIFYTTLISFFIISIFYPNSWKILTNKNLLLFIIIGIIGTFNQICYVKAIKYGNVSFLSYFEYLKLVFMIPLGIFFFDENLSLTVITGSLIIIFSTYCLITKSTVMPHYN